MPIQPFHEQQFSPKEKLRGVFRQKNGADSVDFSGHTIANLFMTLSLAPGRALLDMPIVSIMVSATFCFGVEFRRR